MRLCECDALIYIVTFTSVMDGMMIRPFQLVVAVTVLQITIVSKWITDVQAFAGGSCCRHRDIHIEVWHNATNHPIRLPCEC